MSTLVIFFVWTALMEIRIKTRRPVKRYIVTILVSRIVMTLKSCTHLSFKCLKHPSALILSSCSAIPLEDSFTCCYSVRHTVFNLFSALYHNMTSCRCLLKFLRSYSSAQLRILASLKANFLKNLKYISYVNSWHSKFVTCLIPCIMFCYKVSLKVSSISMVLRHISHVT